MKKESVPQDNSRTYSGHKKVIYATNKEGSYEQVESSGWEPEEFVTLMAINDLKRQTTEAYQRVSTGERSPLEFHMYNKRLDISGLAQASGFFQWQVKRHLKPKVFSNLPKEKLLNYCDILGITLEELKTIPDFHDSIKNENNP